MAVETRTIQTAQGSFGLRVQGPPDGPLVLALHGFPDIAATFDELGRALAERGYRFVAPAMRGYAPSVLDVPKERTLFDTLARDALAVADAVAPGRGFAVVGHDNGAFATYALLRIASQRACAAVTLAAGHPAAVFKNSGRMPGQMWRSRYAMFFQVPRVAEWWASRHDFAYLEGLWVRWSAPCWAVPAAHLADVKRVMRLSWPAPLLHYRAMPFGGDTTPLAQPVLHLIGEKDGCVSPQAGAGQERLFSGPFRSEAVANAGHFLHLEKPELVIPRIAEWLETHHR